MGIVGFRNAAAALAAVVSTGLAACSNPGDASAAAAVQVEPSAEGLLALFREECFKGRSHDWVRARSRADVSGCWGDGACETELNSQAAWKVTATSGEAIEVTIRWPETLWRDGPPSGPLTCRIGTPDALGASLKAAAFMAAAEAGNSAGPSETRDQYQTRWLWLVPGRASRLELTRFVTSDGGYAWSLCHAVFPHPEPDCAVM